jgi:hypothetical protein
MKYIVSIVVVFCFQLNVFAKPKKVIEIGTGIGYIQYTYSQNDFNHQLNSWQHKIAFKKNKNENDFFKDSYYKYNVTFPALYVGITLHKRLQARLSIQIAKANATYPDNNNFGQPFWQITTKWTNYDISLGYYYSFLQNKRFDIASGIGFWANPTKTTDSYFSQFNEIDNSSYSEIESDFMPFFALSTTVNLYNNISLKYDISAMTDFTSYHIRPIGRLSLNYCL